MWAIFRYLGYFFKFLIKYKSVIPKASVGIFIVIMFFVDLIRGGLVFAFSELAESIFGAEYKINQLTHMAITNSPNYGVFQLFEIIVSLFTLYILVKFIAKSFEGLMGAQAVWMCYVFGIIFVAIVSMSYVKIVDGVFGFIPIYDSVIFMFININYVLMNAIPHFWSLFDFSVGGNYSNISTNYTK